jgi:hypothetical protein
MAMLATQCMLPISLQPDKPRNQCLLDNVYTDMAHVQPIIPQSLDAVELIGVLTYKLGLRK